MVTLLYGSVAAAVAAFLIGRFCDPRSRFHLLDRPNARSLHENPTPRSGGLGILGGVAVAWALAGAPLATIMIAAFLLAAVSLVDDARHLPVVVRFGAHLLAAGVVVATAGVPAEWWLPAVLALGWMTNLYNFMDGSDGLAGGMALFGFAAYGVAAAIGRAEDLTLVSACLAAGAAAFLAFNFHPARIFMGDVGSVPIGFVAGALGLEGWVRGVWPIWFPVMVFSPFIADASATLVRRLLRREKVWHAHRDHYYQRMVRSGLGHRNTALIWYAVMLGCGLTALAALGFPPFGQVAVLGLWVVLFWVAAAVVDRRWSRHVSAERIGIDAE